MAGGGAAAGGAAPAAAKEEKKGKRRGGRGFGGDSGFGEDDAPFRMNDAELEEFNAGVNDEPGDTVFGAAFARMEAKQKA